MGLLSLLFWGCADNAEQRCADDVAKLQGCQRKGPATACMTEASRCRTACYARVPCKQWSSIDANEPPAWLLTCLFHCVETFTCTDDKHEIEAAWVCDGERDCVNGADERGCRYFKCDDKGLISASRACDEWPDCPDRSDETRCPYFLCLDDTQTVPGYARCNGNADCTDWSDEEDCP